MSLLCHLYIQSNGANDASILKTHMCPTFDIAKSKQAAEAYNYTQIWYNAEIIKKAIFNRHQMCHLLVDFCIIMATLQKECN